MLKTLVPILFIPLLGLAAIDPAKLRHAQEKLNNRHYAEATAEFLVLEASDPRNAKVQRSLGTLAFRAQKGDEALERYEQALKLDPSLAQVSDFQCELGDAHGLLAMNGSVFRKLAHVKKCRARYEKAVELDSKNIRARWSLMEFYRHAPGFVGGGIQKAYTQALAIKQFNPGAGRFAHATVLASDKKIEEAFALFASVSPETSDDYGALVQLGRLAVLTGNETERGLAALQRSLELPAADYEPGHVEVHYFIGQLWEKKNDVAAARAAYEAAAKLDPHFEPAIKALARES